MKSILKISLSLAFFFYTSFGNSNEAAKKRKVIEELAHSFSERQVFYRWKDSKEINKLLREGVITPEQYQHWIKKVHGRSGYGPGLYVSDNIYSSSKYGSAVVRIEVEPGVKYISFTDKEIQDELSKKHGISLIDAVNPQEGMDEINPRIAVDLNDRGHWLLKMRQGVSFKPIVLQDISLEDFSKLKETKSDAFESRQFQELNVKAHLEERVRSRLKSGIKSVEEGRALFKLGEGFFSESLNSDIRNAVTRLQNLKSARIDCLKKNLK